MSVTSAWKADFTFAEAARTPFLEGRLAYISDDKPRAIRICVRSFGQLCGALVTYAGTGVGEGMTAGRRMPAAP